MDKINKTAIEIELRTGASLMPGDYGVGMSAGLGFTKMLGTTFIAEAGIEGGHFQPVTPDSKGFSPLGSFLGMGLFVPFENTAMIMGARARIGFDFAKWNPLSSASFNTRFVWESRGRDGLVSFFPFVGFEGGYQYNGSHGGMALISAGMIFDIE